MTLDVLPLFAASFGCICVLALFARQNRKAGWVKPKRVSDAELIALERDWEQYPAPVRNRIKDVGRSPLLPPSGNPAEFTLQLAHFQQSLKADPALKPIETYLTQ